MIFCLPIGTKSAHCAASYLRYEAGSLYALLDRMINYQYLPSGMPHTRTCMRVAQIHPATRHHYHHFIHITTRWTSPASSSLDERSRSCTETTGLIAHHYPIAFTICARNWVLLQNPAQSTLPKHPLLLRILRGTMSTFNTV